MNVFKKIFIRTYQLIMKVGIKLLRIRKPIIINCMKDTIPYLNNQKVLIIVPTFVSKNNAFVEFITELDTNNILYEVDYCDIANPTIANVDYYYNNYQPTIIISIGGGSVIDLGKLLAVKMTNKKDLRKMRGLLKVSKKPITHIAVPTTSGSGSETTVAAVVTDDLTHEKYPINDPKIVPNFVVFESSLTVSLPKHLTSTTGMDALTHAIECFIGKANTKQTKEDAINAIKLIFSSLEIVYNNPNDLEHRANMQKAAYLAGCAFTKGYVGYVHAIAHQLGGLYHTPHGLANAVLLPYVLEEFGTSIDSKVKLMGKLLDIDHFDLISKIKELNMVLDIPTYIDGLKEEDFDLIIKRAKKEAHPLYPVPKLFNDKNFQNVLKKALKR